MNLAEVIHAGWSNRDAPNLTLLDAAQADAKDSILLAAELKAIEKGSLTAFGQGPSFQEKNERLHHQELARAIKLDKDAAGELFKELCNEMLESSLEEAYQSAKTNLEQFIEEAPERKFLRSWLDWWDGGKYLFSMHLHQP